MIKFTQNTLWEKRPPFGTKIDINHPIGRNIVQSWDMGGTGNALDVSGRGDNGTEYNGSIEQRILSIDGISRYIPGNQQHFRGSKKVIYGPPFTLMARVETDYVSNAKAIITISDGATRLARILQGSSSNFEAAIWTTNDEQYVDCGDVTLGEKYDIAATFTETQIKVYKNGIQIGSGPITGTAIFPPGQNTTVGFDINQSLAFDGKLIFAHWIDRDLTANEIMSMYRNPWQVYKPQTSTIYIPQILTNNSFGAFSYHRFNRYR